jgi:hypothetical protein
MRLRKQPNILIALAIVLINLSSSQKGVLRNLTRISKSGKTFNRTVTDLCKYWIMYSETKVTGNYSVL